MENIENACPAVEMTGLAKSFGSFIALEDIDLSLPRGRTLAVLGPNGAGKTTLIKLLAGVMRPTSGRILIDGMELKDHAEEVRGRIGLLSHQSYLYGSLSAQENLEFYASMYNVNNAAGRIQGLLETVGLKSRRHDRVSSFSRGMLQRLSLARALLHRPSLLLLDEPETGLDRQGLDDMWDVINADLPGRTVIFTSHNFERALAACDEVLIIARGRVAFSSSSRGMGLTGLQETYRQCTGAAR